MRGGWVWFKGGGGAAARSYLDKDQSTRADDYYLEQGQLTASMAAMDQDGDPVASATLNSDAYQAWVDWADPETGLLRGRVKENTVFFAEKVINADKSLSVAAVLDEAVASQLDDAMEEAARVIQAHLARTVHSEVKVKGLKHWAPVERLEAVTVAHRTSREGDPHRHLHMQILNRVWAEGAWRALDTREISANSTAMNRLAEAVIASHQGLQEALAAAGFTFDPGTGSVMELAEVSKSLSKRAEQISARKAELEAAWRADHPNEEPGNRIQRSWDRLAWGETRAEKTPGVRSTEEAWKAEIFATGFTMPTRSVERTARGVEELSAHEVGAIWDRAIERLECMKSVWSIADVTAAVATEIGIVGITADGQAVTKFIEDGTRHIVSRHCQSLDPQMNPLHFPRHLKNLTTERVIEQERALKGLLLTQGLEPVGQEHRDMEEALLGWSLDGARDPEGNPIRQPEGTHRAALAAMSGTHKLVVVTGAAGSGKTTLLKAAKAVAEGQGRKQIILTPTAKAAEVASGETGSQASTVHALLHAYGYRWEQRTTGATHWTRLKVGQDSYRGVPERFQLAAGTQLVVDEAGMLSQDVAHRLLKLAQEAGAQVVITGDHHQLGAVGRGGVIQMAAQATEAVVDLNTVHRFQDPEYAELSVQMREGADYGNQFDTLVSMGLVRLHESEEAAQQVLAREWSRATGQGRSVVISSATNEQAQAVNAVVDEHQIKPQKVLEGQDGLLMAEGSRIMTRKNDADLKVLNRQSWIIKQINEQFTSLVDSADPYHRVTVPNAYLREHAHLSYAVTAHGAQGMTVDQAHTLVEPGTDAAALYVGMTRGRARNEAHFVAADLEEARAQFVAAMKRTNADHGLDQAREQLVELLKGIDLRPRLPQTAPQTREASTLEVGEQVRVGQELATIIAAKMRADGKVQLKVRPSEDPHRWMKEQVCEQRKHIAVYPPAQELASPISPDHHWFIEAKAHALLSEQKAQQLGQVREYTQAARTWVQAHPQVEQLAARLDQIQQLFSRQEAQSAQARAEHIAHQRLLVERVHHAQKDVDRAGLFGRGKAKRAYAQAQQELVEFSKKPVPGVASEDLLHERAVVLTKYREQFAAFAQEVPAPKQQLQGERLSSWRHLGEDAPRVASELQLKQVQNAQVQAVKARAVVDQLRNGTSVQRAALWARIPQRQQTKGEQKLIQQVSMAQSMSERTQTKKLGAEQGRLGRGRDLPPPAPDHGPSLGM